MQTNIETIYQQHIKPLSQDAQRMGAPLMMILNELGL